MIDAMKIFMTAIALVLAFSSTAGAAIYQQGVVYVIYDEAGERAVTNKTDKNSNGVPDVVEDTATQVNAAREVFNGVFKFTDPLKCERFKNVSSIEIDIESKARLNKFQGIAYSRVRKSKHNPKERTLFIKVANTINPHASSTPTHEYFHLVQYASTYFRNKWYLEGMARWSEDAVIKMKRYPSDWDVPVRLKSKFSERQIFHGSYNMAEFLWYPLAVKMKDKDKIPDKLIRKYKYVDGSRVFQDDVIYGANVMIKILHKMKTKESLAAAEFGSLDEWQQSGQRDERNNKIILNCVREVYHEKF